MKSIITTLALLFVSLMGFGQTSEYSKLDGFFKTLEEHDRFFGSVAVSRNGEIIYSKAIGYADIATNVANNDETKLRVGSITKTFTATLIMKAVEMGKIKLDNTIEAYFPRVQNANQITIRHLLNHRSGITNFTDRSFLTWYTKPLAPTALLDTIVNKGIDFEPNTEYAYSNSNYVLLTFILEDIFGQSYADILQQYIASPLKLTNTRYGRKTDPTQNEARSYHMNTEWTLAPEGDMSIPLGAGGIVSTPSDLCLFAEALFKGKVISAKSLADMKPVSGQSYGFGLEGASVDEMKGWGHPGDIDGFTSSFSYFEEEGLSFALISNGVNYGKHDIAIAVMSEIMGKPYEVPTFEFVELSSEELDQYLGTYETDALPIDLTISKEGNDLLLEATGQSSSILTAEGDHKFSIMEFGVKIMFIPGEKKMHFEQQGMEFDFTLKQPSEPKETISEDLAQYSGTYTSDELPIDLVISKEGDTLMGKGTGQSAFPLVSEGNHVFSNKEIGLTITFIPTEKKMQFEQGGSAFEMKLDE